MTPNALAVRVRDSVLRAHPSWTAYANVLSTGDLEIAVPAPRGSRAGHLIIFTFRGEDIWIRYAPARACYRVETHHEMHAVIAALIADDAFFVVVTDGDAWIETSLLRPGEEAVLRGGQVADVLSWSGGHDRIVTYSELASSEVSPHNVPADAACSPTNRSIKRRSSGT